eukprot:gene15010-17751_t
MSKRVKDDYFTVKFATESILMSSLGQHQNIGESIEKQLRIFYSKLSTDPDDRNWEQFLSMTTISSKYTYINVPVTQEFGPMTDDMVNEQLEELVKLGDSSEAAEIRLKMQTPSLLSDMQAFKHANKGCVFEDFIRWHSSRDWVPVTETAAVVPPPPCDPQIETIVEEFGIIEDDEGLDESKGRTRGKGHGREGQLSARMNRKNIWLKTWKEATPLHINEQTPLFDHTKQAEKAIHYLENIHPSDLLYQILSVIFSSVVVIFSTERNKSQHISNEYCLGTNFPHTKQLVDKYFEVLNQTWPLQVPNEIDIKEKELDLINDLVFGANDDSTTVIPSVKEYIARSYAPRPFADSQTMPHRMYTCLSPYECRVSTLISEEDQ